MATSLGKESFLARAIAVHGHRYDYGRVVYVNYVSPVEVICETHGAFWVKPKSHLRNLTGCGECLNFDKTRKILESSKKIHGDKYDYSEYSYGVHGNFMMIRCKHHDRFFRQSSSNHISGGNGCPLYPCNPTAEKPKEVRFNLLEEKHGKKFVYLSLKGNRVRVFCTTCGEIFTQNFKSHLGSKNPCPRCRCRKRFADFKAKANSIYGERKYAYRSIEIEKLSKPIPIVCLIHNFLFNQSPDNHLAGHEGCIKCSSVGISKQEKELCTWIQSRGILVEENDRTLIKPFELDMVIPSLQLAIEFNGDYWHSSERRPPLGFNSFKEFHEMKKARVSRVGYELIFIWESDWLNKKESIKLELDSILKGKAVRGSFLYEDTLNR